MKLLIGCGIVMSIVKMVVDNSLSFDRRVI